MKISFSSAQRGSAFITTLGFCVILLMLIGSMLKYSTFERRINNRAKLLMESRLAAEAISEYGIAQVKNILESNRTFTDSTWTSGDQNLFIPGGTFGAVGTIAVPPDSFWQGGHIVDNTGASTEIPLMHVGQILDVAAGGLHFVDPTNPDNDSDPLKGKKVFRYDLDILSRATAVDTFGSGNVTKYMKQTFSIRAAPLFSNAVYYNMDLELWPGPVMTVTGSTHTNGKLVARPAGNINLTFAGPVTAVKGFWTKNSPASPYGQWTNTDGSLFTDATGSVLILPAGATVAKPMQISSATTGFSPNLAANSWVESTWNLTGATWQQHIGELGATPTATTDTKANFANWIQQTFKGNLMTDVNGLTAVNLQGIPDYSYTYGSPYQDPSTGTSDAAYTYITSGNDLTNAAHGLIETPRLRTPITSTNASYVKAVEDIKYSRNCGLYIVANTNGAAASGHKPDGTVITVAPYSYRAFMNDTTTNPYTITEVLLPGQDTFGDSPGTANPFTAHKNARPVVQLMNINFATNVETATQRRMTDMRRTAGGDTVTNDATTTFIHSSTRSATNKYVPMVLNMIDLDMNELKKAVRTISVPTGTASTTTDADFYLTGLPTVTWANYIYNLAAVPTNVTLPADNSTRIVLATNLTTMTNAYSTAIWNGAVYVESIAADSFDTTGATAAIRWAKTHEMRNSGVRLINGRGKVPTIGSQGLTIATNDAVYILGSFNADGLASSPAAPIVELVPLTPGASTGHHFETGEVPASVVADAVILLSQPSYTSSTVQAKGWNDALSGYVHNSSSYSGTWATSAPSSSNTVDGLNSPGIAPYAVPYDSSSGPLTGTPAAKLIPEFSEYSVAILCGLVPTGKNGVDQNSGGLHNFPRFLEDWNNVDCRIRGSFVALFECRVATDPWSLRTYRPPNRIWGFNLLYDSGAMPPLTPKTISFRRSGANDITKADYNVKLGLWHYTLLP